MAAPEFVEGIEFRMSRGILFAWIDGKLLGKVDRVDDGISVTLMGRRFIRPREVFSEISNDQPEQDK